METILRRVRMAERQVARRMKRQDHLKFREEKHDRMIEIARMRRQVGQNINAAIKARHEDLKLGPLAPRRDGVKFDHVMSYWGSVSVERVMLQTKLTDEQRNARAAWCGGTENFCLAVGDRVVVMEGPYKGKIAPIEGINKETMTLELGGNVGLVNATMPEFLQQEDQTPVQVTKGVVPVSAVRMVHPITDRATGVTRDVIIRELQPVDFRVDERNYKKYFARMVPGINVRIPWPKVVKAEPEEYAADTLRIDVEERTFVPTLLRPPVPESVIDELRNKYSKFRTRHTPEYIEEVKQREAEKRADKSGPPGAKASMLLPVQELNIQLRKERKQRGQPELTEEMLAKIGEIIARNMPGKVSAAPSPASTTPTEGGAAAKEDAEVAQVRKAVEQLALGGETQPPSGGDQPTAS
ncbi:hypothetical protein VTJ83DRAFT_6794 [Remersonia thermophila]|uniref:KOW domain-containing protein n=1 Tax=Remersonia thermophila TaxID=72144 RepID=A0ABR4D7W4_9PEZI